MVVADAAEEKQKKGVVDQVVAERMSLETRDVVVASRLDGRLFEVTGQPDAEGRTDAGRTLDADSTS